VAETMITAARAIIAARGSLDDLGLDSART